MDEKELVSDTFGRRNRNPEHNANSLIWGLDNWLYTSEHDWHLRFRKGTFEVVPTLPRGQWGGSIDDAGRIYRNVNNGPLFVDVTPARYFMRNPHVVRTRGLYEPLISLEDAEVWPIRPTRGVNRGYRDRFFRPDGSSRIFQSSATPVVYRGDRLPEELRGGVFVTDSTTNLVHWFVPVEDEDGRLSVRAGFERGEIFASSDERLRPVNALSGPDGALYVVDMYRGVVQDVAYQTEYLQDYIRRHDLALPVNRGRIWRIVHESAPRSPRPSLSRESAAGLVAHLSHPNGWWRDTAQQLLVQGGDTSVVPTLRELARHAPDWRTKLHALGTLDGLDGLDLDLLQPLLSDESPEVRAWAIRWSERWLSEPGHPLSRAVLKRLDDPSWTVRRQLAASVGELPEKVRVESSLAVLKRYGHDPITVDAVVSGLSGLESEVLARMLQADPSLDDPDALAVLAGALGRARDAAAVERILGTAGEATRSAATRVALLEGLALGLEDEGDPLRLGREPGSLSVLETGETAPAARRVAARLDWPGKPETAEQVPPLSPEEEARYDAGQEIYTTLCVACHTPDGAANDLAPTLRGSSLLLEDPGVPIRVLLAGKEGDMGLMPPVGAMSNEEIAAVLTYLRREWGHTASPVEPEDVEEIRGLTATREEPWTREELLDVPPLRRRP